MIVWDDINAGGYDGFIMPYVKNHQIVICPSGHAEWNVLRAGRPNLTHSYAVNGIWDSQAWGTNKGGPWGDQTLPLHSLADVEAPSTTISITETTFHIGIVLATNPDFGSASRVAKRHNDGFNAAFVDGHCTWLKKSTPSMWTRCSD